MADSWREATLGKLVSLQRGHDLPEQDRKPGTIPILGSFGVTGYHNSPRAAAPGVTVGRSGASFGVVCFSAVPYWPLNTALYVTDFHGNNERFAYYFLKSVDFSAFNTGSAQPSLNRNHVHPIPIRLPPLPEQRAIAGVLGALDDKIEVNRKTARVLEGIARAVFTSWFVDFDPVRRHAHPPHAAASSNAPAAPTLPKPLAALFPTRLVNSAIGEVPEGWRVGTIRDLCTAVENGGTPKREVPDYWQPPEVPWLTSGEVRQPFIIGTENFISRRGLENSSAKIWGPFTTVVALYGATAGFAALLGCELSANQACCALIPFPAQSTACYQYVLVSMSLAHFQQQSRGSAQQNLSQSIVADQRVLIPSAPALEAFEKLAHPLFERCFAGLRQSAALAALRDALLPKLISGELRIADAEKIVGRAT
jgi:type I restriction enzyme, S subunit